MSMKNLDIPAFFKKADDLAGIRLNDSISRVIDVLGKPEQIIGDKRGVFLNTVTESDFVTSNTRLPNWDLFFLERRV
jgi:hypothetical protein